MNVSRVSEIKDYCEWYLNNVKSPATIREMTDYSLSNNKIGRNIRVSVQKIAGSMRGQKQFTFEDGKWSLTQVI